jgi:GT2 family glycosyltransferase
MIEEPALLILVVLYKRSAKDSDTLKSLIKSTNNTYHLVIWDNSPNKISNEDFYFLINNFRSINYIHDPANLPLSKVYNKVINQHLHKYELFAILDQDSILPDNYISIILKTHENHLDIQLFIPIVNFKNKVISPGKYYLFKGFRWKKPSIGIIKSKNVVCINSGITIRSKYFNKHNFLYNEELTFYGIDIDFMLNYHKYEKYLFILDIKINHDSALLNTKNNKDLFKRFLNRKHAWRVIHKTRGLNLLLVNLYIFYYAIKLTLIRRDFIFLKHVL